MSSSRDPARAARKDFRAIQGSPGGAFSASRVPTTPETVAPAAVLPETVFPENGASVQPLQQPLQYPGQHPLHPPSEIAREVSKLQVAVEGAAAKRSHLPQPLFWSLFGAKIREIRDKKAAARAVLKLLDPDYSG